MLAGAAVTQQDMSEDVTEQAAAKPEAVVGAATTGMRLEISESATQATTDTSAAASEHDVHTGVSPLLQNATRLAAQKAAELQAAEQGAQAAALAVSQAQVLALHADFMAQHASCSQLN